MTELKTYTLTEVADLLKVTRRTIYTYIKDGRLPAIKVGKQWRVTEQALKQYLKIE